MKSLSPLLKLLARFLDLLSEDFSVGVTIVFEPIIERFGLAAQPIRVSGGTVGRGRSFVPIARSFFAGRVAGAAPVAQPA